MEKFLTRLFEDDAFQMKVARRIGWGMVAYAALTILACEWYRLTLA